VIKFSGQQSHIAKAYFLKKAIYNFDNTTKSDNFAEQR